MLFFLLFWVDLEASHPKVSEKLGFSYGPHPRHVLDVVTSDACRNAPVILFFHGGSWRWGQKDYHREIGRQFAKKGVVFATANYRLHPEVTFPSFPEDAARAASWVRKEIDSHGGDGENLFLMGHSAGAHSACMVALDPIYLAKWKGNLSWIRGVIAMSAPYKFDPEKEFLYRSVFPDSLDRNSTMPAYRVGRREAPPFFLMHGRFDPLIRYELSEAFANAVRESGGIALNKVYASHGHFSLIRRTTSWHLWPQPLLRDVLEFVETHGESDSKKEDPSSASSTQIASPGEDP